MKQIGCWRLLSATLVFTDASAQRYVYPAKGQTPEKQKADESACYGWAAQQTGFDPAKPPQAGLAAAQSTQQQQQAASSQQQAAFAEALAACLEARLHSQVRFIA